MQLSIGIYLTVNDLIWSWQFWLLGAHLYCDT